MAPAYDVAIVGGGVIGLTTAYFLAQKHQHVLVLDRGDLGQEASWAGAGILPPSEPAFAQSPFDRLRALSTSGFADFSRELQELTGIANGYRVCGGLEFAHHASAADAEEWRGAGVRWETHEDARALEPALAPNLGQVVHLPDLAQIRNPWHLRALIAACQQLGNVDLEPHNGVERIVEQGRIVGLETRAGLRQANRYLFTAGSWTGPLLEPLGWKAPIVPVRGQIALLNPGRPILTKVLMQGPRYLVPRTDGRILVGSTEEWVGFDKQTTPEGIMGLVELAIGLVPELRGSPIEKAWAGLRPGSADGLPFLGQLPGIDNGYVAAGHFRAGIQLSLGTGVVMAELLTDRPTPIDLHPFRCAR